MGGNYPLEFVAIMSQVSGVTFYLSKSRREVEDHSVSDKLFLPPADEEGLAPPLSPPSTCQLAPPRLSPRLQFYVHFLPPLHLFLLRTLALAGGWEKAGSGGEGEKGLSPQSRTGFRHVHSPVPRLDFQCRNGVCLCLRPTVLLAIIGPFFRDRFQ